jgi:hypothetical protein
MNILFLKLQKADAAKRIVYGIAADETLDRAKEVFDYASSKPHFEEWSQNARKASGGKSLGNVRSMHGDAQVAAGKLTDIAFNDKAKAIEIAAKIVDDNTWQKVEDGVYTGFSIAGRYLKRWADGDLTRYTAQPSEISLVDLPCNPSCGFELVKRDGSSESRAFRQRSEDPLLKAARQAKMSRVFYQPQGVDVAVLAQDREPWCLHKREPHSIGSADPDRKRELGEIEIQIDSGPYAGPHRLRVAHDPRERTMNLHGANVSLGDIDPALAAGFEATAAAVNAAQGSAEQETQRELLAALLDRILRRHKWAADAVVRQLEHERYSV